MNKLSKFKKSSMFTKLIITAVFSLYAILFSFPVFAIKSISVFALFNGKAILIIDGQRQIINSGETKGGLTLVSSTTKAAVIEVDGVREEIGLHINTSNGSMQPDGNEEFSTSVTLDMGSDGFFHVEGEINNKSVVFLVDTGASQIAMSESTARSLDLDFSSGRKSYASTANGVTRMRYITLDKVSIGSIEVDNVPAAVIQDPGPSGILLGMSFLSNLEMRRSGSTMELIQN